MIIFLFLLISNYFNVNASNLEIHSPCIHESLYNFKKKEEKEKKSLYVSVSRTVFYSICNVFTLNRSSSAYSFFWFSWLKEKRKNSFLVLVLWLLFHQKFGDDLYLSFSKELYLRYSLFARFSSCNYLFIFLFILAEFIHNISLNICSLFR